MGKLVKNILIAIIFLFISSRRVNAAEFTKFLENPLSVIYQLSYSQHLQAHIFLNDNKYQGILTAKRSSETYYSTVLIESQDGKYWEMKKEILNLGKDISSARLFVGDNGQKIILISQMDSKDFYRIYAINCDNSYTCDQTPYLVLNPEKTNSNESHGYVAPHIIKHNNKNYLFYGKWGNSGFSVTMAHSDTLDNWQKCGINIINDADGPFAYFENGYIYLLVHRSSGIHLLRTNALTLDCSSTWEDLGYIITKSEIYDQNQIVFPSIIKNEDNLSIYYTGKGVDNTWKLNMASGQIYDVVITPTMLITPTPKPTEVIPPTLTPTPTPIVNIKKIPIIIIPGMLASWNKNAILHNQKVNQSEWKLPSFVQEYTALIETLVNHGYEENKNLYIFNYDWRSSLESSADIFREYLTSKDINKDSYSVIGHSLGGLIARIYRQKYGDTNLNKLLTVGTPHLGAVQSYKAIQAGDIEQENSWIWMAQNLILNLYRNNLENNKQIIEKNLPIIRDLLPTFNYIKKADESEINISSMSIKNNFLIKYNSNDFSNSSWLQSISGENINSLAAYKVGQRTLLDKLLGNYVDGRPVSSYFESGDGLIAIKSAKIATEPMTFELNHGELIYDQSSIKAILSKLGVPFEENKIVKGSGTKITPSIIFVIKSPATIEAIFKDTRYIENDGVIFIENAQTGEYTLNVRGIQNGEYEVLIGEIGYNGNSWNSIRGNINSLIPQLEVDKYKINFVKEKPDHFFFDESNINSLINEINDLMSKRLKDYWREIIRLNRAKYYIYKNRHPVVKDLLFTLNKKFSNNLDYLLLEKIENLYSLIMKNQSVNKRNLKQKYVKLSEKFYKLQIKIFDKKNFQIKSKERRLFETIDQKIIIAGECLEKSKHSYLEILLASIDNLLNEL